MKKAPIPGTEPAALSFDAFRRAAATDAALLGWVDCLVVEISSDTDHEWVVLRDPNEPDDAGNIRCRFAQDTMHELGARHAAKIRWDEMVGSRLSLCLKSAADKAPEILDVDASWIESEVQAMIRLYVREFAAVEQAAAQHLLEEPSEVNRVCVVAPSDDAAGQAEIQRLIDYGIEVISEAVGLNGPHATNEVCHALMRAQSHAEAGDVQLVLLTASVVAAIPGYLHCEDVGAEILSTGVPVVIGMPRPKLGSLPHAVGFAAYDSPAEAVTAVLGIARQAREAERKEQIISAWSNRLAERSRARTQAFAGQGHRPGHA